MKTVIIVGSARNDGDSTALAVQLKNISNWDIIDLNDYKIAHYDYQNNYINDDYLSLMNDLISRYETFVFLTPVYWYAMSGIMKVLFDRVTDLLSHEKDLGRKLRNKNMAVITTSVGENLGDNFWIPFKSTSDYLGMNYIVGLHTLVGEYELSSLKLFVEQVEDCEKINH